MAAVAKNREEQTVLDFFRILSSGELEAIRATLHPDAEWRPMVKDIPGAGVHAPRDYMSTSSWRRCAACSWPVTRRPR